MTDGDPLASAPDGVYLRVRAQPRASKTRLSGVREGALRVHLAAPPVEGEANEELQRFLAKRLGIPRKSVTLLSGAGSRDKRLHLRGVTLDEARVALELAP